MNKKEKLRLMKKFRIKSMSGGIWARGFLDGLQASEDYASRPKVNEEDIKLPILS